jgi:hypothetical protein
MTPVNLGVIAPKRLSLKTQPPGNMQRFTKNRRGKAYRLSSAPYGDVRGRSIRIAVVDFVMAAIA